ncbi:MAG: PFL family protein [Melioribacteraceae bacterium]|nr:PFL family protein [Melioribacteraceae bacterium]MCF8356578.1 PFL family protein [Melioribacteraceae bacterium]MCF8395983.1 PFL family protein [Melioribacteraceae bacterium]MCF8421034.1 PFL family protein [Melioribacteraceae bacterium]
MPYEFDEILETIKMTEIEHFDIRTVTMGISLRDCADRSLEVTKQKIYDKILKYGKNHVKLAQEVEAKYGVSIANKRISITPVSIPFDAFHLEEFVEIAKALDKAAGEIGIDYIAGYSALVQKGFTNGERELIKSIPFALSETKRVCASVNVGTTKAGINIDAINMMADVIKSTAEKTKDNDSIGCAKLVVFCNVPEDNPFVAGAFHGISEPEIVLNVGISGPGVVLDAIREAGSVDMQQLAEVIKKTIFKITRAGELMGREVAKKHGIPFGIVDISLAPTPAPGDSIGDILKAMGVEDVGAPGTTAALAMLNDSVKKAGLMASSSVGGMSGAFIPVSEDQGMIDAVERGNLSLEKLEAMTAVCSVGLDMIAIPGDTPATTIGGIIADECAIGMINNKTTAVRIIPAYGKTIGDSVDYGGLLGKAPILSVRNLSSENFMMRGGKIPAPTVSLSN